MKEFDEEAIQLIYKTMNPFFDSKNKEKYLKILREIKQYQEEIESLRAQNAELVAVLKKILNLSTGKAYKDQELADLFARAEITPLAYEIIKKIESEGKG